MLDLNQETLPSFIVRYLTGINKGSFGPLFVSGNALCLARGRKNFVILAKVRRDKVYVGTMYDFLGVKKIAEKLGMKSESFNINEYDDAGFVKLS